MVIDTDATIRGEQIPLDDLGYVTEMYANV
jgi:hypothetical protein